MGTIREKTTKIVEKIQNASSDKEVLDLWYTVTSGYPVQEVVWVHSQVSKKLLASIKCDFVDISR